MITRQQKDRIGTWFDGKIFFYFYFDEKTHAEERKIATAIFKISGIKEQVAKDIITQLHDELNITCRTELVKEVWIDVSRVYYPSKGDLSSSPRPSNSSNGEINMDFYTDYILQKVITERGLPDIYYGFCCPSTLGRFSRKDKMFRKISNNMLSKCEVL